MPEHHHEIEINLRGMECKACGLAFPRLPDEPLQDLGERLWKAGWDCTISTGFRCAYCKDENLHPRPRNRLRL